MATSTQMKKLKKYWKLTIIVENNFFELPVTIAKIVLTREPYHHQYTLKIGL